MLLRNRLCFGLMAVALMLISFTIRSHTIYPPKLRQGDQVALVASAFPPQEPIDIDRAVKRLHQLGLSVKIGKSVKQKWGGLAGSDRLRADELNRMFADPGIKAIFEIRGGWGTARLLPLLDYKLIANNPKIIIGFSDITTLLSAIQAKTGLVTFHGTVASWPWPRYTVDYMKSVLFDGQKTRFQNPSEWDPEQDIIDSEHMTHTIRQGQASGRLIGGNLTMLTQMLGSGYSPDYHDKILFLEDTDEDYYKIDRKLNQLKNAGILDQINGLVFGKCVDCHPNDSGYGDFNLRQTIEQYVKPLHIPSFMGAAIGHDKKMMTLPEGAPVTMDATQGTIKLNRAAVRHDRD